MGLIAPHFCLDEELEKEVEHGCLLCEMPHQEGDEGAEGGNHEEWPAGNPGCLSQVWYQDVPHWQKLANITALSAAMGEKR